MRCSVDKSYLAISELVIRGLIKQIMSMVKWEDILSQRTRKETRKQWCDKCDSKKSSYVDALGRWLIPIAFQLREMCMERNAG
jgi:hypothetical protein